MLKLQKRSSWFVGVFHEHPWQQLAADKDGLLAWAGLVALDFLISLVTFQGLLSTEKKKLGCGEGK